MLFINSAVAFGLLSLVFSLPGLLRAAARRYVLGAALLMTLIILAAWAPLPPIAGHDYWADQALLFLVSLTAGGLLLRFGNWQPADFGLRRTFHAGTGRAVRRLLLPLLLLELGALGQLIPGTKVSPEYQLLQLAVGVTEELAFRGVLLALLDRAFRGRVRVLGAELGWGTVASSLLFGLIHGVRVEADFHVALHLLPMTIPLVGGFVLAWCRARSGSLLLPILVHSGMNEAAQLIALLKA